MSQTLLKIREFLNKYGKMVPIIKILLNRSIDLVEDGFVKSFAIESIDRDKIQIYGRLTTSRIQL